ncbi:hypothetical protein [uncultured Psychrobacter sp.]|uniref:hypothetical protein n=1 Tax=uncultured Psychrobacter sp. TaxID=259303 RepID=UPI003459B1C3
MKFLELKVPPVLQVFVAGAAMYGVSKSLPELQFSLPGSKWLGGRVLIFRNAVQYLTGFINV